MDGNQRTKPYKKSGPNFLFLFFVFFVHFLLSSCGKNPKDHDGKEQLTFHTDYVPTKSDTLSFPTSWPGTATCLLGNFCYQNPVPFLATGLNLSVTSNQDAWLAVQNGDSAFNQVLHFNGSSWNPVDTNLQVGDILSSVYANGTNQAWVLSQTGNLYNCDLFGCVFQTKPPTPMYPDYGFVNLWGTGGKDAFFRASTRQTEYLYYFNGTTLLSTNASNKLSEPKISSFSQLGGVSKNDVWAIFALTPNLNTTIPADGRISALHFDGTSWTEQKWLPIKGSLYQPSFAGFDANNLWLAGISYTNEQKPIFKIYKGTNRGDTWSPVTTTGLPNTLFFRQIQAKSGALWLQTDFPSQLWRLDETTWRLISELPSVLLDFWVVQANQIRFVTSHLNFYEWDGTNTKLLWQSNLIEPSFSQLDLKAMWGTQEKDYWLVAKGYGTNSGGSAHFWHTDGQNQVKDYEVPLSGIDIQKIWGSSVNDVWFGASQGQIFHFDGQAFQRYYWDRFPQMQIVDIWGSAANDVWAVATQSTTYPYASAILHYDGNSWAIFKEDTDKISFVTVFGHDTNDVWFAGPNTLLHFDGSDFQNIGSLPSNFTPTKMCGSQEIWMLSAGTLYRQSGTTFVTNSPSESIYTMWCSPSGQVLALSTRQTLWTWNGTMWVQGASITSSSSSAAFQIFGTNDQDVWLFSHNGSLLHKKE